jgi:molecular chaperone HscB
MNYYELFELPERPIIDKTLVSKKYIALQKQFHPDFYTNETELDKENALAQSAAINKAYNIFSNKEKTIEYFLQLKAVIVPDEKYSLPPDFLMEMMELNEGFEVEKDITNKIADFEIALNKSAESLLSPENAELLDEKALEALKLYYYKKKYLKRILERLDD